MYRLQTDGECKSAKRVQVQADMTPLGSDSSTEATQRASLARSCKTFCRSCCEPRSTSLGRWLFSLVRRLHIKEEFIVLSLIHCVENLLLQTDLHQDPKQAQTFIRYKTETVIKHTISLITSSCPVDLQQSDSQRLCFSVRDHFTVSTGR